MKTAEALDLMQQPRTNDHCLICGSQPDMIGMFVPNDPEAWGAAPGKARLIRYCLCARCAADPTAPERVEKIIQHEMESCHVR